MLQQLALGKNRQVRGPDVVTQSSDQPELAGSELSQCRLGDSLSWDGILISLKHEYK